jgi:hypothetical protein
VGETARDDDIRVENERKGSMTNQDSLDDVGGLVEVDTQALIRFAAGFLYYAPMVGAQAAYDRLLPTTPEYAEMNDYMLDASKLALEQFPGDFTEWARREILPLQLVAEIKALRVELSRLNPADEKVQEQYNELFGDLVHLEQRRRKLKRERQG